MKFEALVLETVAKMVISIKKLARKLYYNKKIITEHYTKMGSN